MHPPAADFKKLGPLVQKQHTAMGKTDFTRYYDTAPACRNKPFLMPDTHFPDKPFKMTPKAKTGSVPMLLGS
jgi:hypothetical protein